jgi:hypothetical protein
MMKSHPSCHHKAMAHQIGDEQIFALLGSVSNSIALIVKHMAGNMRSRWTDFLGTDGEKPDRHRDSEFVDPPSTRAALMQTWEHGWACVFGALEPLTDADFGRTVYLRGHAHSVMQAINRQMTHYSGHCGQIVLLAKHYSQDQWKSLSIPKNKSAVTMQHIYPRVASEVIGMERKDVHTPQPGAATLDRPYHHRRA